MTTGTRTTGTLPVRAATVRTTGTGDWVEAGPFRAHLRHLRDVGRLDPPELAVLTGLSVRAVEHLLHGRSGRLQRRISPDTARRLLQVRAADVTALRFCLGPAEPARAAYQRLREVGWDEADLAARTGVRIADLHALATAERCSRLVTVRLVALARSLPAALLADVLDTELDRAA